MTGETEDRDYDTRMRAVYQGDREWVAIQMASVLDWVGPETQEAQYQNPNYASPQTAYCITYIYSLRTTRGGCGTKKQSFQKPSSAL